MAESLVVEVLDDEGRACAEGEIGRVVVTDLHNFASPLLRYDIGDYAEVGGRCSCGRTLPTLRRVLGRKRNLMMKADGSRFLPRAGFETFDEIAPIQQYQVIQHALDDIEFKLVSAEPLSPAQEDALAATLRKALAVRGSDPGGAVARAPAGLASPASTRTSSASSTPPPERPIRSIRAASTDRVAGSKPPARRSAARPRREQLDEGGGQRRLARAAGDAGGIDRRQPERSGSGPARVSPGV